MNTYDVKDKRQIRKDVQKALDQFGEYVVTEENNYCFCIHNMNRDSITATLIDIVRGLGYGFLHCQLKNGTVVARFTYEKDGIV